MGPLGKLIIFENKSSETFNSDFGHLKKKLSYQDIGFKIGPLINSSGRMAKANDVVELFLTQDDDKIEKIIGKMNSYNSNRKKIEYLT